MNAAISARVSLIECFTKDQETTIRLLDKIIQHLMDDDRRKLSELTERLRSFEARYALSTAEFQQRFDAGALGDDMDYFEWDAIADMVAWQARLADA